jgi:uncharacterized protein YjbI with pentapeptide repeats
LIDKEEEAQHYMAGNPPQQTTLATHRQRHPARQLAPLRSRRQISSQQPNSQIEEETLKQLKAQGYGKVTKEYDQKGYLLKITGEHTRRDWAQLLIIPVVLALLGIGFTAVQHTTDLKIAQDNRQNDQQIAQDQQRETTLKTYLDDMSDLLLNHGLRLSKPGDEVRQVARERTLTTLRRLDAVHNKIVVQFLQDAGLLSGENIVIDFINADLENDDLREANLSGADLSNTNLSNAHLDEAHLNGATLSNANLSGADLNGAVLSWVHLSNAHLDGATLIGAGIDRADLNGATLIGANLSETFMNYTNLREADLRGANLSGVYPLHTDLRGARYTTKSMQITDQHGKLITLQPTRWRQGFDYKAAGTVCDDCGTQTP